MKGKILAAIPEKLTINGEERTKYKVTVLEGTEAKNYDCWSKRITEVINQDVEYTVEPPKDPKYPAKLVLPKTGNSGNFGGRSYGDPKLTAKTMCLAYAKDLVVKALDIHPDLAKNANGLSSATLLVYKAFIKEVLGEAVPAPASTSANVPAEEIPFN